MLLHTRTDLASEAHALLSPSVTEYDGIAAHEEEFHGLHVVAVDILNDVGAALLNKPVGKYYTLTLKGRFERGAQHFTSAACAISELIRRCAGRDSINSCLVAALGNPDITPDAVGSIAAANILITRHLKEGNVSGFDGFSSCALCRTGVLGTTGVESAAQIRALVDVVRPQLVIAVDALAGSDISALCRTVQLCSSGIAPGSGVGNDREALCEETLGVPVIAIGVPTVIDASAFAEDEELKGMFVTPRDIDSLVRAAGKLIGYGINLAVHRRLRVEDVDMLVG